MFDVQRRAKEQKARVEDLAPELLRKNPSGWLEMASWLDTMVALHQASLERLRGDRQKLQRLLADPTPSDEAQEKLDLAIIKAEGQEELGEYELDYLVTLRPWVFDPVLAAWQDAATGVPVEDEVDRQLIREARKRTRVKGNP